MDVELAEAGPAQRHDVSQQEGGPATTDAPTAMVQNAPAAVTTTPKPPSGRPYRIDAGIEESTGVGGDGDDACSEDKRSVDIDDMDLSTPRNDSGRRPLVLKPNSRWRKLRTVVRAVVVLQRIVAEYRDFGGMAVDADDEEEWRRRFESSKVVGVAPWWIMMEKNWFRRLWEPFMMVPLLYVAIAVPVRIFFQPEVAFWVDVIDWIVTGSFWVDIVVNFCSTYRDSITDAVIVDWRKIALRYMFGWFIFDLVASIPFDTLFAGDASSVNELSKLARLPRSLRLLRLLRLLRALRLVHLQGHLRRVERSTDMHPAIARIFMISFWAFVSIHFLGSIWFYIGVESMDAGVASWVVDENLVDGTVGLGTQYVMSIYFLIVTLTSTGFGEIVPANDAERVYVMVVMLLGLAWAGVVVSSVNTVMVSLDRTNNDIREKLMLLDSFMRTAKLPRSLKRAVTMHLESAARGEQARANAASTKAVLELLSPRLRMEVVLFTNRRQLRQIPILQDETLEVKSAVLEVLARQVATRGDYVTVEGTYATSVCFITSGRTNVLQGGERIASLGSGSYFGLIDCLFSSLRLLSVQAVTQCELYALQREDLTNVLGQFPEFALNLKRRALARLTRFKARLGRDIVEPQFLEQMQSYGIGLSSAILDGFDSPTDGGMTPMGKARFRGTGDDFVVSGLSEQALLGAQGTGFFPGSTSTPGGNDSDAAGVAGAADGKVGAERLHANHAAISTGSILWRDRSTDDSGGTRDASGSEDSMDPADVGKGKSSRGRTSSKARSERPRRESTSRTLGFLRGASSSATMSASMYDGNSSHAGPQPDNRPLSLEERLRRATAAAQAMGDLPRGRLQEIVKQVKMDKQRQLAQATADAADITEAADGATPERAVDSRAERVKLAAGQAAIVADVSDAETGDGVVAVLDDEALNALASPVEKRDSGKAPLLGVIDESESRSGSGIAGDKRRLASGRHRGSGHRLQDRSIRHIGAGPMPLVGTADGGMSRRDLFSMGGPRGSGLGIMGETGGSMMGAPRAFRTAGVSLPRTASLAAGGGGGQWPHAGWGHPTQAMVRAASMASIGGAAPAGVGDAPVLPLQIQSLERRLRHSEKAAAAREERMVAQLEALQIINARLLNAFAGTDAEPAVEEAKAPDTDAQDSAPASATT